MVAVRRRWAIVGVVAVALVGGVAVVLGSLFPSAPTPTSGALAVQQPRVAAGPVGGDGAQLAAIPEVRGAVVAITTTVDRQPKGAALVDSEGTPMTVEPGMRLAVFEQRVVEGETWLLISPLANPSIGPTDYFGWIPEKGADGTDTAQIGGIAECPADRSILALGSLDPFTRARCLGVASVALRGWTWGRASPTWYRIQPAWFGEQNGPVDSTISLQDARRLGQGAFVELQIAPGLEVPPFEFEVDVAAHVADARGAECLRLTGDTTMLPDDVPQRGPMWCATRLVIERWTPVLGPEERPIDPRSPQLHRHPDAGANSACAGVGMPPLVFRIDATSLDPVWLEVVGHPGVHVIPSFGPGFQVAFEPGLVVKDGLGQVVAQDGTPVDPDGKLAGHAICPTGGVVYFN